MRRCELVIFDMDGVLVDTSACHRLAYERLWQRCGVTGPAYETIAGRPTREVVAEFTAPLRPSAGQVSEWVSFKQAAARALLAGNSIVYTDTIPALSALQSARIPMALATGASRETAFQVLAQTCLRAFFGIVVTAEDVARGKPDPEVYQVVMTRAEASPARCVIVEDSAAGIRAGLASGARVASVRTGLRLDHPDFLGSFADLSALVAALNVALP
jgi:HAD superfamily hydrolase (TIGR01509 family)